MLDIILPLYPAKKSGKAYYSFFISDKNTEEKRPLPLTAVYDRIKQVIAVAAKSRVKRLENEIRPSRPGCNFQAMINLSIQGSGLQNFCESWKKFKEHFRCLLFSGAGL